MNKLKVLAVLFLWFSLSCLVARDKASADNAVLSDNSSQELNQELNDEGYGKDDVEYNNSEDEQTNVDAPIPGENANSR